MIHRVTVFLLLAALLFGTSGCGRQDDIHRSQFFAMGTLIDVSIRGVSEKQAGIASHRVERLFLEYQRLAHAWQPGPLQAVNQTLASGKSASLESELEDLLLAAISISRQSNGLFNPCIGQLIALWGFHADEPKLAHLPARTKINELAKPLIRVDSLKIAKNTLTSTDPRIQLDLGAFAKGYAVDRAIDLLKEMGIENAIVNAGGDLRAIGDAGSRPWHIGIRDPAGSGVLASIDVESDSSIFTSGNYERFVEINGKRYHHILDPRTGYPAEGLASVTVIAANGALADAAATALFVAGPQGWRDTAAAMRIDLVMIVTTDGKIEMTEEMARRVELVHVDGPTGTVS